jgi:hypothetical protein
MEPRSNVGERVIRVVADVRPARPTGADLDVGPARVIDLTDRGADASEATTPGIVFEDGCGPGHWCAECREDIRQEALTWIRELNATSGGWRGPVPVVRRITGDLWSVPGDADS